jgi:hypothetical protein
VFDLPPQESDAPPPHVVFALQHVFYDMQTSKAAVSTSFSSVMSSMCRVHLFVTATKGLTTMSGWKDLEKDVSQDAVHLARELRNKLEQYSQVRGRLSMSLCCC